MWKNINNNKHYEHIVSSLTGGMNRTVNFTTAEGKAK